MKQSKTKNTKELTRIIHNGGMRGRDIRAVVVAPLADAAGQGSGQRARPRRGGAQRAQPRGRGAARRRRAPQPRVCVRRHLVTLSTHSGTNPRIFTFFFNLIYM